MTTPKLLWSAKKFFLTFPQTPASTTKQQAIDTILKKYPNELKTIVVAKENHAEGSQHFHIYLEFKKKKQIKHFNFFDFIFNKHGNYQTVRNKNSVLQYISKNGDTLEWGLPVLKQTTSQAREIIRDQLKTPHFRIETIFNNITPKMDETIYTDARKLDEYHRKYQTFLHYKKMSNKKIIFSFNLQKISNAPDVFQPYAVAILPILTFLNKHMLNRHYKAPNLFLWSHKPNTGKSSLFNLLADLAPTYTWPTDHWYQHYRSFVFEFIVSHEFTLLGYQPNFLKLLLGGDNIQLPLKGSHIFKQDNPIFLGASNHSLRELFRQKYNYICKCPLDQNAPTLCSFNPMCKTPTDIMDFYEAIYTRLTPHEITAPIFPDGRAYPDLWQEWRNFLIANVTLSEENPETFLYETHNTQANPTI